MESDGIITRTVYPEVPPRVEYALSELGESMRPIIAMIEEVKQSGVPAVFYIELSNRLMADTIAEATGAEELLLHSCQNVSKEEFERGESYLSLMEQNIETLKIALN